MGKKVKIKKSSKLGRLSRGGVKIHPTAEVDPLVRVGRGTVVLQYSEIEKEAVIGEQCKIKRNVHIDRGVRVGSQVKIEDNCSIYNVTTIEDGVFIGPHTVLTNDKHPRAITPDGRLKSGGDWEVGKILVKKGASIGAHSVVLTNVTIGEFALVGAGSVVTKDVPDFGLAYGNPARVVGFVCKCGRKLAKGDKCQACGVVNNF